MGRWRAEGAAGAAAYDDVGAEAETGGFGQDGR